MIRNEWGIVRLSPCVRRDLEIFLRNLILALARQTYSEFREIEGKLEEERNTCDLDSYTVLPTIDTSLTVLSKFPERSKSLEIRLGKSRDCFQPCDRSKNEIFGKITLMRNAHDER